MKTYPSIIRTVSHPPNLKLYTFDKLDGSNLRFECSKKAGWYKFGTRNRLFDKTDDIFGPATPLFKDTLADELEKILIKSRWKSAVIFCEFYGESSFAGKHNLNELKKLTVIDVAPYKKGILPPKQFIDLFGEYGPKYFGIINWGKEFITEVWNNKIEGMTFEGVVGKTEKKRKLLMYKAKTQQWIDKVRALYSANEATKLIES